jgi:hypothetical protein
MTDKDRTRPSAAEQLARSLDRWTNEGGAAGTEAGALSPGEMHILRCLGAAVIAQWSDLPMPIQKLLFENHPARRNRVGNGLSRLFDGQEGVGLQGLDDGCD